MVDKFNALKRRMIGRKLAKARLAVPKSGRLTTFCQRARRAA